MPLLKVEAEKLSNNYLEAGVIESIIERDPMFNLLPFMAIQGKAYVFDRENTITEGDFIDSSVDVVPEGAATFTEVVSKLRTLIGDVDVDNFSQTVLSDTNDQKSIQIMQRAKGLGRKFHRNLIIGDATANPKEFDGIRKLCDPSQVIPAGTNGAALTLSMLDTLLDQVPYGADALIMRRGTLRAWKTLLRNFGGTVPTHDMLHNFDGSPVPTHDGIPILINDFMPGDEVQGSATATTSIYAVRFNEADGVHGLYAGPRAGISVEDIGPVQNKDATRTRLKWYCGLTLKGVRSLARLSGVTNI